MVPTFDIIIGKYEYKIFKGASWKKIFFQDSNIGSYDDIYDALDSNKPGMYSILKEASSSDHYGDNSYEFLLEYPEKKGYNRWKQNIFPTEQPYDNSMEVVPGYFNISTTWTWNSWGGLARSPCQCVLLDGSIGSGFWFYSIGHKGNCDSYYNTTFPGPTGRVTKVYLWMRIKDIKGARMCTYRSIKKQSSYCVFVLLAMNLS